MPPQMSDAVPNTFMPGHVNLSTWSGEHKFGILSNIQVCTPTTTKHDTRVAITCAINMRRGGTFI